MRDAEIVTHESREASLSSPTSNFHARSRSYMIRFQPRKTHAKLRTVLQSMPQELTCKRSYINNS